VFGVNGGTLPFLAESCFDELPSLERKYGKKCWMHWWKW
jgi:hypothetical protein